MLAVGRVIANLYCLDEFSFLPNVLAAFNNTDIFEHYVAKGSNHNVFSKMHVC